MWRRVAVLALLAVLAGLALWACAGRRTDGDPPETTPTTEAILGGGIRLYCVDACERNFVYQFNTIRFYNQATDLPAIPGDDNTRIIMAWVPASGRLYINEEEIDDLSDEAQVDTAEFWSQYAVTARTFLPAPSAAEGVATADLAVTQSPAETINEVHAFIGETGVDASWQELALVMAEAGDAPDDLTQAQLLVGQLGLGNTANELVMLDEEQIGPDTGLACLRNPSWLYWVRYCSGRWWG